MPLSKWLESLRDRAPAIVVVALATGALASASGACGGASESDAPVFGPGSGVGAGGGGGAGGGASTGGGAGSAGKPALACKPGEVVSCPCPGTTLKGVQTCLADGSALGKCEGCPSGAGGSSSGAGGGAGGPAAGGSSAGNTSMGGSSTSDGGVDLFDAKPPDTPIGDSGKSAATCYECAVVQCKDELAACNADPECAKKIGCLLENCLQQTSPQQLAGCALGCDVPFMGPVAQAALAIGQCAQQSCPDDCPFATGGGAGGSGAGGSGAGGSGAGGSASTDPGAAPDKVGCGTSVCDKTKGEACCISVGFNGASYACVKEGACGGGFGKIEQPCDGPEDCPQGNSCCSSLSGISLKLQCSPMCSGGGSTSLCHTDTDCGGQPCNSCNLPGGLSIKICGSCPGGG